MKDLRVKGHERGVGMQEAGDLDVVAGPQLEGVIMDTAPEARIAADRGARRARAALIEVLRAFPVAEIGRAALVAACGRPRAGHQIEDVARVAPPTAVAVVRLRAARHVAPGDLRLRATEHALRGDAEPAVEGARGRKGPAGAALPLVVDAADDLRAVRPLAARVEARRQRALQHAARDRLLPSEATAREACFTLGLNPFSCSSTEDLHYI